MLRWLLAFSLQFRFLVVAVAAAIAAFGVFRLPDAPRDILPEFGPPVIEIQTEALGLSAAEVEDLITVNLEEIVASVAWLKSIRSKSISGLSSILLVFEPGTDIMRARQLVAERLTMAHALPNVSKPPIMLQPLAVANRAMMIGLSSKDMALIDLSVQARWTIVPKLLGVKGVANVAVWGLRARQLQVQVDPERLRANGITLDQIVRTAGDSLWVSPLSYLEASTVGTGGWIDTPNQRLGIQHIQPISTPGNLGQVNLSGTKLRLNDIAKVVEAHPPLIGDAVINGAPGLLLVVERFPTANVSEVIRDVDAALTELRQGLPGVEIDPFLYRASSFIDLSGANLGLALLLGALVLGFALLVLQLDFLAAFICIVAVLLTLVMTGLWFYLREVTFNMMILAGLFIALPVVIDDAVSDIQNIMRSLRRQRLEGSVKSPSAIIFLACLETRSSLLHATLIILLAVTPILFLEGVAGALLTPLVISFVLALLASTVVAVTVTPALAALLLSGSSRQRRPPPVLRWIEARYHRGLSRILGAPRAAFALTCVILLAGLAIVPALGWSLLPSFKEGDVRIAWEGSAGTSHPEMRRIVTQASHELRLIPGVRNVSAHLGRAVTGDQVVGIESGQLWVNIDAKADHAATLAAIRETVRGYPGFEGELQTYLRARMEDVLASPGEPIVLRIEGPERAVLRNEANKLLQMLADTPGVVDPRIDDEDLEPQLEIRVDLAAAGRAGLKPGDVRRAAATVFAGLEVGNLFEQQKVFDVVVWGVPGSRQSLTDLREFLIDTPDGGHVRLADVAAVEVVPTPRVITREGVSRHIDVRAGATEGAVARDVKDRLQKIAFPFEYHAFLVDDYAQQQKSKRRALIALLAAAMGTFFLFQASSQSWRLAAVCFPVLPAALTGGVLAMVVTSGTVLLGSLAGLLAVLALVARNSIMLIARCRHLEGNEGLPFGRGLVLRAARERLGATVTTAVAAGLAFLAVTSLGERAGLEILHPAAVVILGGLLTSMIITLFVVPALYLRFAGPRQAHGSERHAL